MTLSMYHVIKAGGLGKGGCNFDAKVRRQSFTPEDMVSRSRRRCGPVCPRSFLTAAKLIEDGKYDALTGTERYAGWQTPEAKAMLDGTMSLDADCCQG